MKALVTLLGVSAFLTLCACQSLRGTVSNQEDLLAAAGFDARPANSPAREAALKRLPPNKFVTKTKGDRFEYVYADPIVCNCLYVGDQRAFDAYKQELLERHIADEQQVAAEMYEGPWVWESWDWAPWGPRAWWW
jgi:hypothetical protein